MKKLLYIAAAALFGLTACTEDYKDWVPQQQPTQPKTVTFGSGSITEVPTVDLNNLAEGQTMVKIASITAPTSTDESYTPIYTLNIGDQQYDLDAEGQMSAEELQAIISEQFGRRPIEQEITATVSMWITNGATTIELATSDPFVIKAIPQAPIIEPVYFITGNVNGWDNSDTSLPLTNGGGDVYEDPVFTCMIPALEGTAIEFKVTPQSGLGGWSKCLTASSEEGKFLFDNAGGNIVIPVVEDALFYRVSFNLLDQTYEITPVGFADYIYEIGNESGWSENHPLHGDGNGTYTAIHYLDGEFKFKPNKENWDGDYEKVSGDSFSGTLTQDGGPNMDGVPAGYYFIKVDLKALTYEVTPVNSISIIGSVKGMWDTDVDMTYNENLKCWEAREALSAGEFKFRLNHDWAINWGGTEADLTQDGANLQLAEDNNYLIRLYLSDEAPAHCTVAVDLGFPDNIYEIGNESGWGTSHLLAGNGKGQYAGIYYLNGEFKFKPNADNWEGDFEKLNGDAYAGTLTTDGGPNVDAPETGVYQINVDLAAMTYQLTAITSVSIIGSVKGMWDTDVDLTYNAEDGCWEVTDDLGAGEWKFRANHDWGINWGGSENDLSQDGANLQLAEEGNYTVKLYLSYAGNHYCTVTKN